MKYCHICGDTVTPLRSTYEFHCGTCRKHYPWHLSKDQKTIGYGVCPDKKHLITEDE
jgi:hypothetical protein